MLHYPSPQWLSYKACGRLESLSSLTAFTFLPSSCLHPCLPFWRAPILYGLGEKGNCHLLHHGCKGARPSLSLSPVQTSGSGRAASWVGLSQANVCSQNSDSWAVRRGRMVGVPPLTAVQAACRCRDLNAVILFLVLKRLGLLPILQACPSASHWFREPQISF